MICHGKDVESGWLDIVKNNRAAYETLLGDAFQLCIIKDQLDKLDQPGYGNPKKKKELQELYRNLSKNAQIELKILQAPIEEIKKYCLSEQQRKRDFQIVKRGGVLGGLETRYASFRMGELNQMKVKNFKTPIRIQLEDSSQFTNLVPWPKSQNEPYRLAFFFKDRTPIVQYFKDVEQARKQGVYMVTEILTHKTEFLPKLTQKILTIYYDKYNYLWNQYLEQKIMQYAQYMLELKRQTAQFTQEQKEVFYEVDMSPISYLIQKWKKQSQYLRQIELEEIQRRQIEEEELRRKRIQIEEEERKKKQEQEANIKLNMEQIQEEEEEQFEEEPIPIIPLPKNYQKQINFNEQTHLYVRSFLNLWAERSEFRWTQKPLENLNYAITLRTIQVHESIPVSRILVTTSLNGERTHNTFNMMQQKTVNSIRYRQNPGSPYFMIKMQAQLKEKGRLEYFNWELKENAYENLTILNSQRGFGLGEGCLIHFTGFSHKDFIEIEIKEALTLSEQLPRKIKLNMIDFLLYSKESRVTWIPIEYDLSENGVIMLGLDIHVEPYSNVMEYSNMDEKLLQLIRNNFSIFDPIYTANFRIPNINYNTVKVALKTLEQNNPFLKSSLQLILFMLYIGQQSKLNDPDEFGNDDQCCQFKVFLIRKIIENICHQYAHYPLRDQNLLDLQSLIELNQGRISGTQSILPKLYETLQEKQLSQELELTLQKICYSGIPPYARLGIWFTLLGGQQIYEETKDICKRRFFIFPETRTKLPEQTWAYQQLNLQVKNLQLNLFKDIEKFIETQNSQQGIPTINIQRQLRNVLQTFLVYGACKSLQININYLNNLFLIALRIVSMTNMSYPQQQRWFLIEETNPLLLGEKGITNVIKLEEQELENEGFAFWVLCVFVHGVLGSWPVFSLSQKVLHEDTAYVLAYLEKYNIITMERLKTYDLQPESLIFQILLKLFADIFHSEMLYSIWDLLVFEHLRNQKFTRQYNYAIPSILATLLDRISSKIIYIYTQDDLITSIQIEASLISNMDEFKQQVQESIKKMKQAIENRDLLNGDSLNQDKNSVHNGLIQSNDYLSIIK